VGFTVGFGLRGEFAALVVGVPGEAMQGGVATGNADGYFGAVIGLGLSFAAHDGAYPGLAQADDTVGGAACFLLPHLVLLPVDFGGNEQAAVVAGTLHAEVGAGGNEVPDVMQDAADVAQLFAEGFADLADPGTLELGDSEVVAAGAFAVGAGFGPGAGVGSVQFVDDVLEFFAGGVEELEVEGIGFPPKGR
jgi:hypothetical protein